MGQVRRYKARCRLCFKKDIMKYHRGTIPNKTWENIEWVRMTQEGHILRCRNCGHEYYSSSLAAYRLAIMT